jgi:hypothetical protein
VSDKKEACISRNDCPRRAEQMYFEICFLDEARASFVEIVSGELGQYQETTAAVS